MLVAVYRDPNGLPGSSVARIMRAIAEDGSDWLVCSGAIDGAMVPVGIQTDGSLMALNEFLREVACAAQLDWGDCYILRNAESAARFKYARRDYRRLIPQAEYLVRAVDDEFIYVFTLKDVSKRLAACGVEWESLSSENIDTFVYPE